MLEKFYEDLIFAPLFIKKKWDKKYYLIVTSSEVEKWCWNRSRLRSTWHLCLYFNRLSVDNESLQTWCGISVLSETIFVYVVSSEMLNRVQHDVMKWNRVQDDTVLFSCHYKLDLESQFSVKQSLFMWLVLRYWIKFSMNLK